MKQSRFLTDIAILRRLNVIAFSGLFVFATTTLAQAQSAMTGHVRDEVRSGRAAFVGRMPATQPLKINIALPLRNTAELDTLLEQLYDPRSGLYHQFLTVQEFTDRFGPTEESYAEAIRFAEQNGLTVTGTFPNRMVLNVTGQVENIERAFQLHMGIYQHPTENRTFYSPDREPSASLFAHLWHVSGLDSFSIPHPMSLVRRPEANAKATGSGPGGYFIGSDLRAAYYGGSSLTGSGQSVALVEFAGYNINDVDGYFTEVGQPLKVGVTGISTDGSSLSCTGGCDDTEQALDIEVAISMAPGLSSVRVYVSDTSDVSIFNEIASDNISKSISCSWGWSPADPSSDDPIFKELAAQGQSLFVASGDSGAYTGGSNVFPADDPYVTSVGGTDLTTNGPGGVWLSETAWGGSGGGISPDGFPIPSYQAAAGVITSANNGSTTYRNSPDIAAEANTDNYICYDATCAGGWGGTSFAAPRWAGYVALINQQHVSLGTGFVGFLNPLIYGIGLKPRYPDFFHDITSGSNGTYLAVNGYDLVTGWGSPNDLGLRK